MTEILEALNNTLSLVEVREELFESFSELGNDDPHVKKEALETINIILDQDEILGLY